MNHNTYRRLYDRPRTAAIQKAGLFNETLVTCEDEELDYRIRQQGQKIVFTPDAPVHHYRRPTWLSFYKQAYRYALGRMQAIKLHHNMGRWFHYLPFFALINFTLLVMTGIIASIPILL